MTLTPEWLDRRLRAAAGLHRWRHEAAWLCLFLDYDGTLAEFSPTPGQLAINQGVVRLLRDLVSRPGIRVSVVSGRRLGDLKKLLPVEGVWLAGTYGIELYSPSGETIQREPFEEVHAPLETLKPRWERLLQPETGFYLEDKGWSLAIHARFAPLERVEPVLAQGRQLAQDLVDTGRYRFLGGDRFLEIAPLAADKGDAIRYLVSRLDCQDALLLYVGDDDKDEAAFEEIKKLDGVAVLVSFHDRPTRAGFRLESPSQAREWLGKIAADGGR
jgi:trehalose-phosphatase